MGRFIIVWVYAWISLGVLAEAKPKTISAAVITVMIWPAGIGIALIERKHSRPVPHLPIEG